MIKKTALFLLILCLPLFAFAAQFEEGKQYKTLDTSTSATPKITEFFSFYCPHCYRLEPAIHALKKTLPQGVALEKSHVNFLGGLPKEVQSRLSTAYLVAQQQGKGEQVAAAIFNAIHRDRNPLQTQQAVSELLNENGVSAEQFTMLSASSAVLNGEKNMVTAQDKYAKLGALKGVPTVIVNDKYLVNVHELKSQQELNELVQFLLKK